MKLNEAFTKKTYGVRGSDLHDTAQKIANKNYQGEVDLGWVIAQIEALSLGDYTRKDGAHLYYDGLPALKEHANQEHHLEMYVEQAEDEGQSFDEYFEQMMGYL